MYLFFYILFLFVRLVHVANDCGCNLNRNAQCLKERTENIYSAKLNKNGNEDNKEKVSNEYVQKHAFNEDNMVLINGGTFQMGTNEPVFEGDFEGPVRNVTVSSFYLDKFEVSNRDFSVFVEKTGYITEAEKFGDSFVFELLLSESQRSKYEDVRAVHAPWWIKMKGALWKHPEGKASSVEGI